MCFIYSILKAGSDDDDDYDDAVIQINLLYCIGI